MAWRVIQVAVAQLEKRLNELTFKEEQEIISVHAPAQGQSDWTIISKDTAVPVDTQYARHMISPHPRP